jgi:hypothetical protein
MIAYIYFGFYSRLYTSRLLNIKVFTKPKQKNIYENFSFLNPKWSIIFGITITMGEALKIEL